MRLALIGAVGMCAGVFAQSAPVGSARAPSLSVQLSPSGLEVGKKVEPTTMAGSMLAFSALVDGNWDIFVWEFESARPPKPLTRTPYDEAAPSLSYDRTFCIYESVDGKLWRQPLNSEEPAQALPFGSDQRFDMHPAVSPDNRSVVMATSLDRSSDDSDLIVYDFAGKQFRRRLELMSFQHYPAWAPDGHHVVFSSLSGRLQTGRPITEIWAMHVDAPWARQLTMLDSASVSPSWSPDGSLIAFASNRGGPFKIWLVDPVSRAYGSLTSGEDADSDPVFSPDGRSILFVSVRGGRSGLWRMNLQGGPATAVTPFGPGSTIPCKDPDWK